LLDLALTPLDHLGNMELKIEEIDDIEATRQRLDLIDD
jgi:hypothetical protein